MASRMRWTARVGVAALAVGVAAPTAWAATWTPGPTADKTTGFASAQYSWNYGSSLAKVGSSKLAFAYTTDVDVPYPGDPDAGAKQKIHGARGQSERNHEGGDVGNTQAHERCW